jgi:hypothetical protein
MQSLKLLISCVGESLKTTLESLIVCHRLARRIRYASQPMHGRRGFQFQRWWNSSYFTIKKRRFSNTRLSIFLVSIGDTFMLLANITGGSQICILHRPYQHECVKALHLHQNKNGSEWLLCEAQLGWLNSHDKLLYAIKLHITHRFQHTVKPHKAPKYS